MTDQAPSALGDIICRGCGRRFLVVGGDEPVIVDARNPANSEPLGVRCACGSEIWLESEGDTWRDFQLFALDGRRHQLTAPAFEPAPAPMPRLPLLLRPLGWLLLRLLDLGLRWSKAGKDRIK